MGLSYPTAGGGVGLFAATTGGGVVLCVTTAGGDTSLGHLWCRGEPTEGEDRGGKGCSGF